VTPIWFLADLCFVIAAVVVVLPWLRTVPGLSRLPVLPWYAGALALLLMLALGGLFHSSSSAPRAPTSESAAMRPAAGNTADTWADIANNMAGAGPVKSTGRNNAQPMNAAVVSLQKRLASAGGSAEDWELLAKSYEFLGRPAEAGKARAHQLPPLPEADSGVPR
jgi:cytochrome c-type biogenesis protein CcmH/NrfG